VGLCSACAGQRILTFPLLLQDVDVEAMSLMKKDVYESTLPSVKRIESTFKVVEAAFAAKIPMAVVSGCRNVRKQWTF